MMHNFSCQRLVGEQRFTEPIRGKACFYTVFQKSDAKTEITITTSNLIRIKHPLSNFNYRLSGAKVANFNKIHRTVSEQQLFKNGTQKQKFPIWKSRLSSWYTLTSVTVCALDTFSAAAVRKQDA